MAAEAERTKRHVLELDFHTARFLLCHFSDKPEQWRTFFDWN